MFSWFRSKKEKTAPSTERPLVLIIDDEDDLCQLLRMALLPHGYHVDMAFDGQKGLDLIRARNPDLILLDIKMPRVNGYQVLAQLQQDPELNTIPVIVMTSLVSSTESADTNWTAKMGIAGMISKPFDPEDVVNRVNDALKTLKPNI